MAALNAAGYDAELASPNNHPIRNQVREELSKRNIASLPALKAFIAGHHKPNDTRELSQYISYALCIAGPPNFEFNKREIDIPPEVTALRDFSPLLAAFYKEANVADLWNRSQRAIEQYIQRYHTPVSEAVLQVN